VVVGIDVTPDLPEEREAGATLKERTVGRGWQLFEPIDAAYERGEIDRGEWHRRIGAIIGPAYLGAANPRGQSGSSSTPAEWEQARRFIFAAVNRDGTFLDVGCANGHLMECAVVWLAEVGYRIEPYGLEILPELAALARQRLPQWADRIAVGNAIDWVSLADLVAGQCLVSASTRISVRICPSASVRYSTNPVRRSRSR
jgi:hypothetical protein